MEWAEKTNRSFTSVLRLVFLKIINKNTQLVCTSAQSNQERGVFTGFAVDSTAHRESWYRTQNIKNFKNPGNLVWVPMCSGRKRARSTICIWHQRDSHYNFVLKVSFRLHGCLYLNICTLHAPNKQQQA